MRYLIVSTYLVGEENGKVLESWSLHKLELVLMFCIALLSLSLSVSLCLSLAYGITLLSPRIHKLPAMHFQCHVLSSMTVNA